MPPPNADASFTLTATSASNGSVQATQTETFAMPAVDAVKVSAVPAQLSSTPGAAATTAITLINVGNVSESVALSASAPADVAVDGLSSATLAPGESKTITITVTPAATAALNSTLLTTITADFGPAGNPQTASALVSLLVRSAQTVAISQASIDATSAGNAQLGGTLAAVGDAVSQLQASPADANLLSRVQLLLNNLSAELAADPALAALVAQLAPLQADANSGDVAGLMAALPAFFQNVDAVLAVEANEQFTISISPNEVDLPALANQQKTLSVQITNTGPAPETLNLSAGALPGGVTADLAQAQITLQAGETQKVNLTLTSNLVSTKVFTLDVHAAATATQHDATAVVAVRAAAADVLGVTVSPVAVNAGDTLSVSATVFNTANASRNVLAHITVLDATNQVVASAPDVPLFLSPTAAAVTFDLGALGTAGLANGVYSLQVSLRASDGSSLPGKTAQAPFVVGLPISATVSANPTTLPPGDSNVTTTITVSNQNPGNFTPLIVQQPSGGGSLTNQPQSSGNNLPPSNAPAGANPSNFAPSGFPPLTNATPDFTSPAPPSPPAFNPPAGDNLVWVGPASGDWNVAANWLDTTTSTNHVP
ncbi:MAG TPA: hypothetical protein VFU81_01060, partial [Thermomicrobiales bacterium]|nr:hypothetical protein [Thermomicrobiales bacterium]